MKLAKVKAPNTYLLIFSIIIITAGLTWLIPSGEYDRSELNGRMVVVSNSYHAVDSNPQGLWAILKAPIRGFTDKSAALIVGFVLIVGGVFAILEKTKAIDAAIKAVAKAHSRSKLIEILYIPIFMTIFSIGGGSFGMGEEVIPFILIFIPLTLALGYDSIVGVAIPFVGAGAGFAGAFLNPFTVGIAQQIAGLPLFSGIIYRLICWFICTAVAIAFVMLYALKIKKHPAKSISFEIDEEKRKNLHIGDIENFKGVSRRHRLALWTFAAGMIGMIFGVLNYKWYIEEICAVFFLTGILVGIVGRLSIKDFTASFVSGAKDMVGTVLIIVLARGILIIAEDGRIIDTMLNSLVGSIQHLHPIVSSQAMFVIHSITNFFVPSGSAKAALTMPIMVPLADLVGVTRQTAVLAFQFGDGFSNMIIPTSGITMGVLTLSGISWEKWAKWLLPLEIIFLIVGFILLVPPFIMGW
ncbi:MAG TPA: putative basic amino acid antiporter YfcC [Candidatus Marinimicrobia bacterium]|nr:putative basic amino acid antiporter YfcC [Candidatus Neomarinimicrobiota bacterium]